MPTLEYLVRATDQMSAPLAKMGLSAEKLDRQLGDLSKRVATPTVDLRDKKARLGLADAQVKLDRLSKTVANPKITVEGLRRAELGILRVDAMLDGLDAKHAKPRGGFLGMLGGLLGGGGAASGAGPGLGALASTGPYGAAALGAGGVLAASLAPAALPTLAGAGLGGLGAFLAAPKAISKAFSGMAAAVKHDLAPLRPLFAGIFAPLPGFVRSIGPQLRDMFKASVPFLKLFVTFGQQAAKQILPVMTQALRQMRPSLPIIAQGLAAIVQGLADMVKAIGPRGMKASAQIFMNLCKVMGLALTVFGKTINFTAVAVFEAAHKIHGWWDWLRAHTAAVFDGMRHDIARDWDLIYSNTIGAVIRIVRGVLRWIGSLPGAVRRIFSGAGKWLFSAGQQVIQGLWNGLLSIWKKVTSWISGIASWIKAHKGPVHLDAHLLEPAGRAIMGGLLRGLTGGFGPIGSFIGGVAGKIAGLFGGGAGRGLGVLEKLWVAAGGPAGLAHLMAAIAMAESGGNPAARNASGASGLWQILGLPFPGNPFDPLTNARMAVAKWRTQGLGAWVTFTSGAYRQFMAGGGIIREPVFGLGMSGRQYMFGERGPETVTPGTAPGRSGPLFTINGDMVVQDATDVALVASRLSFLVSSAGLGS
jgi:hypothetical protein